MSDPSDAPETGANAAMRAINAAIDDINATFAADLRAMHGAPEWERPASKDIKVYRI